MSEQPNTQTNTQAPAHKAPWVLQRSDGSESFALPDDWTVTIRGEDVVLHDQSQMAQRGLRDILAYGYQRIHNDVAGRKVDGRAPTPSESIKLARDKNASLMRGDIGRATGATADPVAREAEKIATQWLRKLPAWVEWVETNKLTAEDPLYDSEFKRLVAERANNPKVRAAAQATIDARSAEDDDEAVVLPAPTQAQPAPEAPASAPETGQQAA